jgi:hypothetical protein
MPLANTHVLSTQALAVDSIVQAAMLEYSLCIYEVPYYSNGMIHGNRQVSLSQTRSGDLYQSLIVTGSTGSLSRKRLDFVVQIASSCDHWETECIGLQVKR